MQVKSAELGRGWLTGAQYPKVKDCVRCTVSLLKPSMGFTQAKAAELGMGLAYRTVQYPQMEDCATSGKAKDLQIGERYHVTYLNAAGREVSAKSACSWFCNVSRSLT